MKVRKRKRTSKLLIVPVLLIGILIASGGTYAAYMYAKVNTTLEQISVPSEPSERNQTVTMTTYNQDQQIESVDKPLTFLLTAVDERAGSEGSLNTDVMMLFSLNKTTKKATIVSIPRDLEVTPEQSGLAESHKANYFYAYNYNKNKKTALQQTKLMYSRIYQVPIDYMAIINFEGFKQLVDELGGLQVNVDMDMKYTDTSDGTHIDLRKGEQLLSGSQTLDFIRYRKSNQGTKESSDVARNEREQAVLDQILDKLTSFRGVTAWSKLLEIIGKNVKTDMPVDELKALAASYQEVKPETIHFIHLDGEWHSPYLVIPPTDLNQALNELKGHNTVAIDSFIRTD
ncbi:LCP family protein [Paenibacillus hexagrammi]|uniref:LCP family protein n=1 Tax=Paenibacillus hexagrammi TaxID=2908839 RepID=A0ABY3SRI4_9BACL|nr:LCP family protein [Paenibacillus sp. YPD9-1]UJF36170.1 LCP family protein [Paenibacillus sp. YPD9-1]